MEAKNIKITSKQSVKEKAPVIRVSLEGKVGSKVNRANYSENGHWSFPRQMGKDGYIGFVYLIRNTVSGRCYIGKKVYRGAGKLNRGQETNWPWYISSSKELSEDIKKVGKEGFEFICLEEYKTKGALSWAETWSLCNAEVPEDPLKWYNVLINKVSWRVKEKITQLHKERLQTLKEI